MDNYIQYKYCKGKIYIKDTAIPHKFDCQARKYSSSLTPRQAFLKINRKRDVQQILLDVENEKICEKNVHKKF